MDRIALEPSECDICPTHAIMAIFKTNHPNNYHRLCTQCKDDLERRALTLSIGKLRVHAFCQDQILSYVLSTKNLN